MALVGAALEIIIPRVSLCSEEGPVPPYRESFQFHRERRSASFLVSRVQVIKSIALSAMAAVGSLVHPYSVGVVGVARPSSAFWTRSGKILSLLEEAVVAVGLMQFAPLRAAVPPLLVDLLAVVATKHLTPILMIQSAAVVGMQALVGSPAMAVTPSAMAINILVAHQKSSKLAIVEAVAVDTLAVVQARAVVLVVQVAATLHYLLIQLELRHPLIHHLLELESAERVRMEVLR